MLEESKDGCDTSRLLCLTRRSASYAALGKLTLAMADMTAALELQPSNPSLNRDLSNLRRALDTSEGSSFLETEEEEIF